MLTCHEKSCGSNGLEQRTFQSCHHFRLDQLVARKWVVAPRDRCVLEISTDADAQRAGVSM